VRKRSEVNCIHSEMEAVKLTKEGYDDLKTELEKLEDEERPQISKLLKEAIEQGDLSENDAYHQAKDRQGRLEMRILEIKKTLSMAKVVDGGRGDKVEVGSNIKIKSSDGTERNFVIVNSASANPTEGKLSYDSPLGLAFMGHKKGDGIEIELPSGKKKYTILEIK